MSAMDRPRAHAGLLAAVAEKVPARLVKKLDADRAAAEKWAWSVAADQTTVTTDGGETVTLVARDGVVATADDVKCTCLLSPRCFHVLASVASLPIAEAAGANESGSDSGSDSDSGSAESAARVPIDVSRRRAARRAREVAADVLTAGAHGVGAVLEGELLRAVHDARTEGLHRLAAAGLRVVRDLRDLRAKADNFSAAALVDDLRELVQIGRALDGDDTDAANVGVARRAYRTIGNLRLVGVCSEPIVAKGGYGGVVTHLCDAQGTLYTIGDVKPGGLDRALGAYEAAVAMGDTTIPHRALGRGGLFVHDATASPDLRLGAGKDVKAVRASGGEPGLRSDAIRARFATPLRDQIARAYRELALDDEERPRSAGLIFVRGVVAGWDPDAVWLQTAEGGVRMIAASSADALAFHRNLRVLAGAEGLPLEIVGRVVPEAARTVILLAFGPGEPLEGAPSLKVPDEWRGLVNAGYDVLVGSYVQGRTEPARRVEAQAQAPFDPLVSLRRRIERYALHGARSLPPEALTLVDRERRALSELMMPAAATLLGALAERTRARNVPRLDVADAWLALATFDRAATISLRSSSW